MKLIYFDFPGRAGPIRQALGIGGVPFEDERFAPADWPMRKGDMPLGAVPVLDVDGIRLCHSNAILRYAGRLAGLYPDDPLQAAQCDQVLDTVEEILTRIVATFPLEAEEQRKAREELCTGVLPFYLKALENMIGATDGPFVADGRLTVADLKLVSFTKMLASGQLDHIATDLAARCAPGLVRHCDFIGSLPEVASNPG